MVFKRMTVLSISLMMILCLFSASSFGQLTGKQTGVPIEALQQNLNDYMSFLYSHGQLCQKTLMQTLPGVRGMPIDLDINMNVAGIITSRWKQKVVRPDGTKPMTWLFECVSQIRSGRRLAVLSLVMYEQRGEERRGVELLTNRDVRIDHNPHWPINNFEWNVEIQVCTWERA